MWKPELREGLPTASPVLREGRACGQLVWKTGTREKLWQQLLFWRALVDLPGLWGCQGGGVSILSGSPAGVSSSSVPGERLCEIV